MIKFKLFGKKGNTLYYPGCLYRYILKEFNENYLKILDRMEIDYIYIDEFACCCLPLYNSGMKDKFVEYARKLVEILRSYEVTNVITSCPACAYCLKEIYPKFFDINLEVKHITQIIYEKIKSGKLSEFKDKFKGIKATYHDPCHLRLLKIFDEPREILKYLGFDLVEMELSREFSYCCGGGGGLRARHFDLSQNIAKERIKQALKTNAKILVTSCPMCYLQLKKFGDSIKVEEFSSLFRNLIEMK